MLNFIHYNFEPTILLADINRFQHSLPCYVCSCFFSSCRKLSLEELWLLFSQPDFFVLPPTFLFLHFALNNIECVRSVCNPINSCYPLAHTIGNPQLAYNLQCFLLVKRTIFSLERQIPLNLTNDAT